MYVSLSVCLFLRCISVGLQVCVYHTCTWYSGWKRAWDPLKLELQMVMSHCVGARNWIWVPYRSSKCSELLAHLYSHHYFYRMQRVCVCMTCLEGGGQHCRVYFCLPPMCGILTGTQDVKFVLQRLIHTETSCCPASYDFKNFSTFLNWIVSVFSFTHSFPSTICEYQAYPQNIILTSW